MAKSTLEIQKEHKKINKEMAKAANAYMRMRTLRKDDVDGAYTTGADIDRFMHALVELYADTIRSYLEMPSSKRDESIETSLLVDAFYHYKDEKIEEDDSLKSIVKEKVEMVGGQVEPENIDDKDEEKENNDQGLTDAQKNGLREIAKWMYRNSFRQGRIDWIKNIGLSVAQWAKHGNFQSDYSYTSYDKHYNVDQIMSKSEREKLLIYYLVENRKTNGTTVQPEDVNASQSYVPNLENFKDRMIATRWKFWKRVQGNEIYWEKLGTAAQLAEQNAFYLTALKGSEVVDENLIKNDAEEKVNDELKEEVKEEAEGEAKGQAQTAAKKELKESDREEAKKKLIDIGRKGSERKILIEEFDDMLKEYQALITKRDDLVKDTEEYNENENTIKNKEQLLQDKLNKIVAINKELPNKDELIEIIYKCADSTSEDKKSSITGYIAMGSGSVLGNGLAALPSAHNFISIGTIPAENLNIAGGAFGTLGAVSKLVSAYYSLRSLLNTKDVQTFAENTAQGLKVARTTAEGLYMGAAGLSKIIQHVEKAGMTLQGTTEKLGSYITGTAVVAGIGMVTEAITFTEAYNRFDDTSIAAGYLKDVEEAKKKRRELSGRTKLSENDRREDVLDKMLSANNSRKRKTAAFDMVGSGIAFAGNTLTVMGPLSPVGMILSLVGTGVKVIGTLWNMWDSHKGKKETVYNFFGVYDAYNQLISVAPEKQKQTFINEKKAVLKELRHMILAKLNLFSLDQGYFYAVRKMAELLYYKTFFKNDRSTLLTRDDLKSANYEYVKSEYVPRLKVLGFKPQFPERAEANGFPQITVNMIMVKLQ